MDSEEREKRIEGLKECCSKMLTLIGEDNDREGLVKTPERVARAILDTTAGYAEDPEAILRGAMFKEDYSQMVIVKDIDFTNKLDIEAVKYPVSLMFYDINNKLYYDVIDKILSTSLGTTNEQKIAYNEVAKKLNYKETDIKILDWRRFFENLRFTEPLGKPP